MELTPEQLQQQQQLMDENWNRIRIKLSNCDADTQKLSQHLNIPCDIFIQILVYRGQAIVHSLYSDELNVDKEKKFIKEDVNPILSKINPPLMVDPVKWIEVIEYLRMSLKTQYQQPVVPYKRQIESRKLEQSPAPPSGRSIPITRCGRHGKDIPSVLKKLYEINAHIVDIFNTPPAVFPGDEDVTTPEYYKKYQYYMLIRNIMDTHKLPSVTLEEYARLFGDVFTDELLQPTGILLNLFNTMFPHLDAVESLAFACRAYIDANQDIIAFLISLEQQYPKTFYVIARLMHSYATNVFDRKSGKHLGGKKSRSKKRGRKSVHRRNKSTHNKRR